MDKCSFPYVESSTLGADEEVDEVPVRAIGISLDVISEVGNKARKGVHFPVVPLTGIGQGVQESRLVLTSSWWSLGEWENMIEGGWVKECR